MFDVNNFRSLLNKENKKLYSPTIISNVVNFDILHNEIYSKIKCDSMIACIIYGSFLSKRKPRDIDCLVIVDNNIKSSNIFVDKSEIKTKEIYIGDGWHDSCISGYEEYGPIYRCEEYGKWNPIPIDLKIRNINDIKTELEKNNSGNINDTCCFNAITTGCVIASHKNYNSIQLFNLENENKYEIKKRIYGNRYKIYKQQRRLKKTHNRNTHAYGQEADNLI